MKKRNTKRAVGVLYKDDKVLLLHRIRHGKEYYVFPGGEIEEHDGETPQDTVVREIKEETGLTVAKPTGEPFLKFEGDYGKREGNYFLFTEFTGTLALGGPEKYRMNEDNQYHLEWKTLAEFEKMENFFPPVAKEKVLAHLKTKT